jgi:2-polyprenyl-6-hydroxyphenyl methylase/3-demethylubiquinone-9 3-methyltransferase
MTGQVAEKQPDAFAAEIAAGTRFRFGDNWRSLLASVTDERIDEAVASLREMLEVDDLAGLTFLAAGSGSGLFSLAARRLGATVQSFDIDPSSVYCTNQLREKYFPGEARWSVSTGSVLDRDFMTSLGRFDVVYSWGVLHHTGSMYETLDLTARRVQENGRLFIAIYNDQGVKSLVWRRVKQAYCASPPGIRHIILGAVACQQWWKKIVVGTLRLDPLHYWRRYYKSRGMSPWVDVKDWAGGLPFEVARPEQVLDFVRPRGFELVKLFTAGGGLGNNQYVFLRKHGNGHA